MICEVLRIASGDRGLVT